MQKDQSQNPVTLCTYLINLFIFFPQIKNKPYHQGKYMCILEQGAIANSNVEHKNFVWVEFNCLFK
jgi:hypothetical protein